MKHVDMSPEQFARDVVRRYGISNDWALELYEVKVCESCRSRDATCIDHDHNTGRVRGRICNWCNTILKVHVTVEWLTAKAYHFHALAHRFTLLSEYLRRADEEYKAAVAFWDVF